MTERRHKKAVRSARKCENLLDRQRGGNKNGYKWRKSVRCRLHSGSGRRWKVLRKALKQGVNQAVRRSDWPSFLTVRLVQDIQKTMERQVWAYDLSDGGLSRRFSPVCKAAA